MGIYPPIGKEKKGQYPENIWNDINVRFLGAFLAQKLMHHDNRILFRQPAVLSFGYTPGNSCGKQQLP